MALKKQAVVQCRPVLKALVYLAEVVLNVSYGRKKKKKRLLHNVMNLLLTVIRLPVSKKIIVACALSAHLSDKKSREINVNSKVNLESLFPNGNMQQPDQL